MKNSPVRSISSNCSSEDRSFSDLIRDFSMSSNTDSTWPVALRGSGFVRVEVLNQEKSSAIKIMYSDCIIPDQLLHPPSTPSPSVDQVVGLRPCIRLTFGMAVPMCVPYAVASRCTIRLRRRDVSKNDAVEAGFEPSTAVPRCHSTHSLAYANSQFQASDLNLPHGHSRRGGREFDAPPTAVVGPRQCIRSSHVSADDRGEHHHTQYDNERYRRSLQQLNASTLYSLQAVSYSESPLGSGDMSCNFLNDPCVTPRGQRRSVQNVNSSRHQQHQQMFFDGSVMTSTPVNKVAVAPQPQVQKSRHRHQRDSEVDRNQQFGSALERRNSNAGLVLPAYQAYIRGSGEERLVDGPPPSPKDSRVTSLEQRVRELEAMVVGQAATANNTAVVIPVTPTQQSKHGHVRSSHVPPPTQLIISNSSPSSSVTQQLMAKEVVSKEVEIERLQAKLRKAYAQMERQQADYDEEVRKFKKDSEQAKEELVRVVNKLNDLEAESVKYQEKAKVLDSGQLNAIAETQEKIRSQEKELARLRSELAEKEKMMKSYEDLKKEFDYLELQNDTLSQTLDSKENTVKELERHIASMRMEATLYQQSCSSGSTPLADETESLAEIRPPFTPARPYTKAHSTLGANLSPQPRPKSGGLTKSLSNYAIDANCNRRDDVSAAMSRSLRSTQKKLVDSRLLVKCLKETVERLARGENPDISRLLGIKTDSMSESEAEQVAFDSTTMTMGVAEKMMRRQEESMAKLEQDLDAIRYLVQDYYQAKVGDTLNGRDDACRIQ
uniref:Calponin-homology (CH) domain-containing protein n=1 Tax=Haemonchus contortus TaxID=6289 RepID=A0A7I4YX14_HAECO